MRDILKRHLSQ